MVWWWWWWWWRPTTGDETCEKDGDCCDDYFTTCDVTPITCGIDVECNVFSDEFSCGCNASKPFFLLFALCCLEEEEGVGSVDRLMKAD